MFSAQHYLLTICVQKSYNILKKYKKQLIKLSRTVGCTDKHSSLLEHFLTKGEVRYFIHA